MREAAERLGAAWDRAKVWIAAAWAPIYGWMIGRGLSRAHSSARGDTIERSALDELDLIVFSDHHKGVRDDADDFWRCEAAYNAALGYYLESGYHLVVLGDAEELWESPAEKVVGDRPTYQRTLTLEGLFASSDRYTRVYGNHDDQWEDDATVLKAALGVSSDDFRVREALCLELERKDGNIGRLFLTHGHQGTLESQLLAPASKFLVRHGWSRVQRLIRRPWNTPARDHALRGRHNSAMCRWASSQREPLVLIAGHTHQPVFRRGERSRGDLGERERRREQLRIEIEHLKSRRSP
jgi:hypothetical protein